MFYLARFLPIFGIVDKDLGRNTPSGHRQRKGKEKDAKGN